MEPKLKTFASFKSVKVATVISSRLDSGVRRHVSSQAWFWAPYSWFSAECVLQSHLCKRMLTIKLLIAKQYSTRFSRKTKKWRSRSPKIGVNKLMKKRTWSGRIINCPHLNGVTNCTKLPTSGSRTSQMEWRRSESMTSPTYTIEYNTNTSLNSDWNQLAHLKW